MRVMHGIGPTKKKCAAVSFIAGVLLIAACSVSMASNTALKEEVMLSGTVTIQYSLKSPVSADIEDNPAAQEITRLCLRLFESADDRFRLMITPQILKKIRKKKHVEIVLDKEIQIQAPIFGNQEMRIQRLLIPLEGEFAWNEGARCVIFFGNPEIEEFNVAANLQPEVALSQFLKLVEKVEKQH